jgi:hypothetical protein
MLSKAKHLVHKAEILHFAILLLEITIIISKLTTLQVFALAFWRNCHYTIMLWKPD